MFEREKCAGCETYDCLTRCQYMDIDRDTAKIEMEKMIGGEDSFVLHECATCFACDEYCKRDAHPFDLIVEMQEEKGIQLVDQGMIDYLADMWLPKGELMVKEVKEPVMSQCLFSRDHAFLFHGKLFEDLSFLKGRHFFCLLGFHHMARNSIVSEHAETLIDNVAKHGVKELICFHDECYGFFASYAPRYGLKVPFKPIHLFEYLYNYLKEHKSEMKELNMKIAYQRPCSSRFTPEKEHFLDDIFDLIGVERVEREYDRENCLCCGGGIRLLGRDDLADEVQKKNVGDMVESGAEACIFNCPMCYDTLKEKVEGEGLKAIMISDLCRLAVGETPDKE